MKNQFKWTLEEEIRLFCLVERVKLQYEEIQARYYPELTTMQLRNKYYGLIRRKPNLLADHVDVVQKVLNPQQDLFDKLLVMLKRAEDV